VLIISGNTRTVGQQQLNDFREAIRTKVNNPFEVLLHRNKLPMSLLDDNQKVSRMHLLNVEKFDQTFGPKAQRKRPKLTVGSLDEFASKADSTLGTKKYVNKYLLFYFYSFFRMFCVLFSSSVETFC
jgi:nuclear GTP-binding protein